MAGLKCGFKGEGRGDMGKFYVFGGFLGRKWVVESMLGGGANYTLATWGRARALLGIKYKFLLQNIISWYNNSVKRGKHEHQVTNHEG